MRPAPLRFSLDDVRVRARHGLLGLNETPSVVPNGDHVLDGLPKRPASRQAAVLVPIVAGEQVSLLFTRRAAALREHSGQVAFPGGRIDPGDASAVAAALREAFEEIGLAASRVEPIGLLDPYLTGTGYRITPVVALVQPPFALKPNPTEVEAVFEMPLAFAMDPSNHLVEQREWDGGMRSYYSIFHAEETVWGATAGIVRNLHDRLYA